MTGRRRFIATASGLMAADAAAVVVDAPRVIAQPKVQWRTSTVWPPQLDLQGAAARKVKLVSKMSGDRFQIQVYPRGPIVPPLRRDLQGRDPGLHGRRELQVDKEPAAAWLLSSPFGMAPRGMGAC